MGQSRYLTVSVLGTDASVTVVNEETGSAPLLIGGSVTLGATTEQVC